MNSLATKAWDLPGNSPQNRVEERGLTLAIGTDKNDGGCIEIEPFGQREAAEP